MTSPIEQISKERIAELRARFEAERFVYGRGENHWLPTCSPEDFAALLDLASRVLQPPPSEPGDEDLAARLRDEANGIERNAPNHMLDDAKREAQWKRQAADRLSALAAMRPRPGGDGVREALEDRFLKLREMSDAPRDGTLLILWIEADDDREHPLEDSGKATPTIGFNNFDNDGEDVWKFAGWCWEHDHFTEGKGTPLAWSPFPHRDRARLAALPGGDVKAEDE